MALTSRTRRLALAAAAALALIAVLAIAVPYVYIHVVEGSPPAALRVNAPAAGVGSPGGPGSSVAPAAGIWTVASGSQAGYRVAEVLAGQRTTAVGRTSAVTGRLTVTDHRVTDGSFTVDLTRVTSDQTGRDEQFRGRIMNTDRYPTATFTLTQPLDLGALADTTGTTTVTATGQLALHGTTRALTTSLSAARTSAGVQVSGQLPVRFADYGIANPSVGSFVRVDDTGVIEVLLALTRA